MIKKIGKIFWNWVLGLTKEQIKKLQYEEARVKKIIELQNKK